MKNLFVALVLLTGVSGFGDNAEASYEVPGFSSPGDVFEMDFQLEVKGNQVSGDYTLPEDLTGPKNRIEVAGNFTTHNVAVLMGPKADMTCNFTTRQCDVKYFNLKLNLAMVEQRLKSRGLRNEELQRRLKISRSFIEDPIGIIRFSLEDDK